MRIAGTATLHAPVEAVYQALQDPAVLVRTIPGCQRLERVGEDAYAMTVTAGVAAVRGTYAGDVRLSDQRAPHGFVLKASGSGAPGTVSAEVAVELAPGEDGSTVCSWDADAVVGGMLGGVGQRLLAGVAKRTAGEFFAAVDQVLAGQEAPAGAVDSGAPPSGPWATLPAGAPQPWGEGAPRPAGGGVPRPAGGGAPSLAEQGVFTAPVRPRAGLPGGELAVGVVLGAAAALVGVVVGGWLARRAARGGR